MTTHVRVECYLREKAPRAAKASQQAVLARLRELERAGVVDELAVETWGTRAQEGDPSAVPALAACEGFDEWARTHETSLRPAFDSHRVRSSYTGSEYRTTVLPVMALAIYENDQLTGVYPHSKGRRPQTVETGVRKLESMRNDQVAGHPPRP